MPATKMVSTYFKDLMVLDDGTGKITVRVEFLRLRE
jgi:hypothetical protein